MKVITPSVELLSIFENSEKLIEKVGRTCYKSENKITKISSSVFCNDMLKRDHMAMIEFGDAVFKIITDRGITHEIVRHRLASYAQESTRYCNYSKDKFGNELSFIHPPNLNEKQENIWLETCKNIEKSYLNLINNGCTPQTARSILPNCLKTEICMKANFREWRHFIKLRGSKHAHPQIRSIAFKIHKILMNYAPDIFNDLNPIK